MNTGKVCCISGMHRSGTSLTASWLQSCGLPIDTGRTITPDAGNPRGYFEDLDFLHLQQRCIRSYAKRTSGWRIAPADFLALPQQEMYKAQKLIDNRSGLYPAWGWKDPRTVLFLPSWKALIPNLQVVLLWRPCVQVLQSLLSRWWRSGKREVFIGPIQAIRLWHAHNERALAYWKLYPEETLLIPLDRLIADDLAIFTTIQARFGLPLCYSPLNKLYEPALLHDQNARACHWPSRLVACADLEKRLMKASLESGELLFSKKTT